MLGARANSDLITLFEAVGRHSAGKMSDAELRALAERRLPSCRKDAAGMFTATPMNLPRREVIVCAVPRAMAPFRRALGGKAARLHRV